MSWWQKIVGTKPKIPVFETLFGPQGPQGLTGTTTNANSAGVIGHNNAALAPNQGPTGAGVVGQSATQHGVWGEAATSGEGVHGLSHSGYAGVGGYNHSSDGGPGVWAESAHGMALHVEGDAEVTGDVKFVNGDCAEEFDVQDGAEIDPGTVVVIDEMGCLTPSAQPYDRRVAGIVSGAGEYRPAIILDRQTGDGRRQPVALVGKVYCKVNAEYAPIAIGDMLTTSPTPGHAMKAGDPTQAFGAVIGKALRALPEGRGMIPVLVALQ
ncbi:MAG TPA: hypothetical protein VF116_10125 [Ktedonobacterales bacterium]